MGVQITQAIAETPAEKLVRSKLESATQPFTLISGEKALGLNTLNEGDEFVSSALSVADFQGPSWTLTEIKLGSKNFATLSIGTHLSSESCHPRRWKKVEIHKSLCLARHWGARLKKPSKYEVHVNFNKLLPMCQMPMTHLRKAITEAIGPHGNTACLKTSCCWVSGLYITM